MSRLVLLGQWQKEWTSGPRTNQGHQRGNGRQAQILTPDAPPSRSDHYANTPLE